MSDESQAQTQMTPELYLEKVLRTESTDMEAIQKRLADPRMIRVLHAAMGMVTEAGEILDMVKAHVFYGKPFDAVNAEEEVGDESWYQSVMISALRELGRDTSWAIVWAKNIAKLEERYKAKRFDQAEALERDFDAERSVLEGEEGAGGED